MKFGENLHSLSIPEWKAYNFDYNDLKSQIKYLTKISNDSDVDSDSAPSLGVPGNSKGRRRSRVVTLTSLRNAFMDNFNYVDLFIVTKRGELERKLLHHQKIFNRITLPNSSLLPLDRQIQLNDLHYQVLEVSKILRDLNRFIIVQKIASNKIFKKFLKYYPDEQASGIFVQNMKQYLATNENSFVNIDLTNMTLELAFFLDMISDESKRMKENSQNSTTNRSVKHPLISNKSTVSTSPTSTVNSRIHEQQLPITRSSMFDLEIITKKNFKIDCLIADNHNLNELILNLRVLINCEPLSDELIRRDSAASILSDFLQTTQTTPNFHHSLISYTFLANSKDSSLSEPTFIISQFNQPNSLIISHVGGLRRYAYCSLPNHVVQLLIDHFIDRDNREISSALKDWFQHNHVSPLTKMAVDWVLNKNLKPIFKSFSVRSRYVINKSDDDGHLKSSNGGNGYSYDGDRNAEDNDNDSESSTHNKVFEDDFLLCLDQDIVTSNNPNVVNTLKFDSRLNDFENNPSVLQNLYNDEVYDRFPFHKLSMFSNDSNMSNFKRDMNKDPLTNKENTEPILMKPNARSMKKIPTKIQQLLKLDSINLFNGEVNFFQYMLSCYYNVIPPQKDLHNHYLNLLTLNLLKQNENISISNQVTKFQDKMFEKKSRQVLKSQTSLKSIKLYTQLSTASNNHHTHQSLPLLQATVNHPSSNHLRPEYQFENQHAKFQVGHSDIELLQENYNKMGGYGTIQQDPMDTYGYMGQPNWGYLDKFVNAAAEIKHKILGGDNNTIDLEQGMITYLDIEDDDRSSISTLSSHGRITNIRDKYEEQNMRNYDQILSIIYFSFFFISLFISSIIMGIVYSLIELSTDDSQFLLEDNVLLILTIVIGLLLSLIFSMISINLNLSRYRKSPSWHSAIVWTGSGVVFLSFMWSMVLLFQSH